MKVIEFLKTRDIEGHEDEMAAFRWWYSYTVAQDMHATMNMRAWAQFFYGCRWKGAKNMNYEEIMLDVMASGFVDNEDEDDSDDVSKEAFTQAVISSVGKMFDKERAV